MLRDPVALLSCWIGTRAVLVSGRTPFLLALTACALGGGGRLVVRTALTAACVFVLVSSSLTL